MCSPFIILFFLNVQCISYILPFSHELFVGLHLCSNEAPPSTTLYTLSVISFMWSQTVTICIDYVCMYICMCACMYVFGRGGMRVF